MEKLVPAAEFERLREDRDALANEVKQLRRVSVARDPEREQDAAIAILRRLPKGLQVRVVVVVSTMQCGDLYATAKIEGGTRWVGFPQASFDDETFARVAAGLIAGALFGADIAASVPPRTPGGAS